MSIYYTADLSRELKNNGFALSDDDRKDFNEFVMNKPAPCKECGSGEDHIPKFRPHRQDLLPGMRVGLP